MMTTQPLLQINFLFRPMKISDRETLPEGLVPAYITAGHESGISYQEYLGRIENGNTQVLTAYYFTPEGHSIVITRSADATEIVFACRPESPLAAYREWLQRLDHGAEFCTMGFEIQDPAEDSIFPFCYCKDGKSVWYGNNTEPDKESFIAEALSGSGIGKS